MAKTQPNFWIEEFYCPSRKTTFFRVLANYGRDFNRVVVGDYWFRGDACNALESARRFK